MSEQPKQVTRARKAGEAGAGIGAGGGAAWLATVLWPDIDAATAGWIAAGFTALVTSGTSFLRRYAIAYDSKFLKVLLGIQTPKALALLLLPGLGLMIGGCASVTPEGLIRSSGDTTQDTLFLKGKGSVSYDETTGVWEAACEEPECQLTWTQQESINGQVYRDIAEGAARGAASGISPAP